MLKNFLDFLNEKKLKETDGGDIEGVETRIGEEDDEEITTEKKKLKEKCKVREEDDYQADFDEEEDDTSIFQKQQMEDEMDLVDAIIEKATDIKTNAKVIALKTALSIAFEEQEIPYEISFGSDILESGGAYYALKENAEITRAILNGEEKGAKRHAVCLNAGAALYIAGKADTLEAGVSLAEQLIDSGAAAAKLAEFIEESNKA